MRKKLSADDGAVSPVIGVILMVAITVILAAVIATFVLGLGEQVGDTGPTVSIDFEYDEGDNNLTATHTGGNTVEAGNLYLRGSTNTTNDPNTGSWNSIGSYGPSSQIKAGSSVTVHVNPGDTVRVVWESDDGSSSTTLESWEGPDA